MFVPIMTASRDSHLIFLYGGRGGEKAMLIYWSVYFTTREHKHSDCLSLISSEGTVMQLLSDTMTIIKYCHVCQIVTCPYLVLHYHYDLDQYYY